MWYRILLLSLWMAVSSAGADSVMVKALTFNVWGLPSVSMLGIDLYQPGGVRFKEERLEALCEELRIAHASKSWGWDVVFLQEVWEDKDRHRTLARCGYPYVALFDSKDDRDDRMFGNGLMILSRYPLREPRVLVFPENGDRGRRFSDGEALVRKGVGWVRMVHPSAGTICLANTHLVSEFPHEGYGYRSQRKVQFEAAVRWVLDQSGSSPVIFGGDFNFGPNLSKENATYDPMFDRIGRDLLPRFRTAFVDSTSFTMSLANPFHRGTGDTTSGLIDHLFFSPHFRVLSGRLAFERPVPTEEGAIHLSDHFGFEVTATIATDQWASEEPKTASLWWPVSNGSQ